MNISGKTNSYGNVLLKDNEEFIQRLSSDFEGINFYSLNSNFDGKYNNLYLHKDLFHFRFPTSIQSEYFINSVFLDTNAFYHLSVKPLVHVLAHKERSSGIFANLTDIGIYGIDYRTILDPTDFSFVVTGSFVAEYDGEYSTWKTDK